MKVCSRKIILVIATLWNYIHLKKLDDLFNDSSSTLNHKKDGHLNKELNNEECNCELIKPSDEICNCVAVLQEDEICDCVIIEKQDEICDCDKGNEKQDDNCDCELINQFPKKRRNYNNKSNDETNFEKEIYYEDDSDDLDLIHLNLSNRLGFSSRNRKRRNRKNKVSKSIQDLMMKLTFIDPEEERLSNHDKNDNKEDASERKRSALDIVNIRMSENKSRQNENSEVTETKEEEKKENESKSSSQEEKESK